jgi:glutathione S-transferase
MAGLSAAHVKRGQARLHAMLDWPVDAAVVRKSGSAKTRKEFELLTDRVFTGHTWLVGDNFTIADIAFLSICGTSPDAGSRMMVVPRSATLLYAVRSLPGFINMPGIHQLHELRDDEAAG